MTIFEKALVIHLVCDWLLQNHSMANNKMFLLRSPAGWIHAGIHFIGMLLVFPVQIALIVALLHMIIDTRIPLKFWSNLFRQTAVPPIHNDDRGFGFGIVKHTSAAIHVSIWGDQVLHIVVLAFAVLISGIV